MNINTMKAVVVEANKQLAVQQLTIPQIINDDEVLVKVIYSGVCGSDIPRVFHNGAHFYPIVLGHEFSGTVVETGKNVSELQQGDLVSCAPLLPCFDCPECNKGFYSLCKSYTFVGSRRQGANAEYICVNKANLVKLTEQSNPLHSAFIEPITVSLHAINLAGGCANKNVVIIGAGTIGLLAMQSVKALGAATVSVVDINQDKLDLAKQLGADRVFNSRELSDKEIYQQLDDIRFEQLVLETAGVPQTVALSIQIAGPRAQLGLIGTLHQDLHLDQCTFGLILRKELAILGSWMNYSKPWPGAEWMQAIELVNKGLINFEPLIASIDLPEQYVRTVLALDGKPMNGKIILKFN